MTSSPKKKVDKVSFFGFKRNKLNVFLKNSIDLSKKKKNISFVPFIGIKNGDSTLLCWDFAVIKLSENWNFWK